MAEKDRQSKRGKERDRERSRDDKMRMQIK